jgi:hypothetical protein
MSSRTVTANEQIVWMRKGKMLRLGTEQRVCGPADVVVIPRGSERWFREDTEVIDFFAPPRDDLPGLATRLYERRLRSLRLLTHETGGLDPCGGRR